MNVVVDQVWEETDPRFADNPRRIKIIMIEGNIATCENTRSARHTKVRLDRFPKAYRLVQLETRRRWGDGGEWCNVCVKKKAETIGLCVDCKTIPNPGCQLCVSRVGLNKQGEANGHLISWQPGRAIWVPCSREDRLKVPRCGGSTGTLVRCQLDWGHSGDCSPREN